MARQKSQPYQARERHTAQDLLRKDGLGLQSLSSGSLKETPKNSSQLIVANQALKTLKLRETHISHFDRLQSRPIEV